MNNVYQTPLKGEIALTRQFSEDTELQKNDTLYKIIWVTEGSITFDVDHAAMEVKAGEIVPLTPLQHLSVLTQCGTYVMLLFNSSFYCIYGHDDEVSCNGLLFHGGESVLRLHPSDAYLTELGEIVRDFEKEYDYHDGLKEEMLRILLKRFIITCTRIARDRLQVDYEKEKMFDIVRRFYVLVDNNYRTKKQVQDYADMLNRSPKTLSNLFASYHQPSPLRIIHNRISAEAKRLLLYTTKSAKEISDILGFEDLSTFSRFFKNQSGESISDFRKKQLTQA